MLKELTLVNFRNFSNFSLKFSDNITIILGDNGAGKTSILEALNVLALGKSFRVSNIDKVIKSDSDFFRLNLKISNLELNFEQEIKFSKKISSKKNIYFDNNKVASLSDISKIIPLFLMEGDYFRVFNLGSLYRQKIVNWTMFHVEHQFYNLWKDYNRALKQKNTLLKQRVSYNNLKPWDEIMADTGEKIYYLQQKIIKDITPIFFNLAENLNINTEGLELTFSPGWDINDKLINIFKNKYLIDMSCGYTSIGPHKFDINFQKHNVLVRDLLSRGQQKLVLLALGLACAEYLYIKQGVRCIFLLDDIASELDLTVLNTVIDYLLSNRHQIIMTSLFLDGIKNSDKGLLVKLKNHIKQDVIVENLNCST